MNPKYLENVKSIKNDKHDIDRQETEWEKMNRSANLQRIWEDLLNVLGISEKENL